MTVPIEAQQQVWKRVHHSLVRILLCVLILGVLAVACQPASPVSTSTEVPTVIPRTEDNSQILKDTTTEQHIPIYFSTPSLTREPAGKSSPPPERVLILMYHNIWDEVCTVPCPDWVTSQSFEDQVRELKAHGYTSISLDELHDYISGRKADLPGKSVIITFDDGYQSHYTVVFPILRRFGYKAVLFVPTGFISDNQEIRGSNEWDATYRPKTYHLIWPELEEMLAAGFSVESHTHDHLDLTRASDAEIRLQISLSSEIIKLKLGVKPDFLAYPYGAGHSDNRVRSIIQQVGGYKGAVAAWPSSIENTATADIWALKRYGIERMHSVHLDPNLPGYYFLRLLE